MRIEEDTWHGVPDLSVEIVVLIIGAHQQKRRVVEQDDDPDDHQKADPGWANIFLLLVNNKFICY